MPRCACARCDGYRRKVPKGSAATIWSFFAILQEDADRLRLSIANDRGQSIGALHGDAGPDEADDAAKLVGAAPRSRKSADGAGARASQSPVIRFVRGLYFLATAGISSSTRKLA
jgi:hypothetical protein